MSQPITWHRNSETGYEVSSRGDITFSALYAKMPGGRTIEQWYQCDIKGYDIGGTNWKLGKGKPPLFPYPGEHLWELYLSLWRLWAIHHSDELIELLGHAEKHGFILNDMFATTKINQAHALATILNEWVRDK